MAHIGNKLTSELKIIYTETFYIGKKRAYS